MADNPSDVEAKYTRPIHPEDLDMRAHSNGHLSPDEFGVFQELLAKVLCEPDIASWLTAPNLTILGSVRNHPQYWGLSKATYKKWGGNAYDLEKAADHFLAQHPTHDPLDTAQSLFDPFAFTDARSLIHTPRKPRRWLVPGLIADGLTIIGGSPKSGKSYLAYGLALGTAVHGQWCNHWPVDKGKVVFVALEDDAEDTQNRLEELDPHLELPAGQLYFLHGLDALPKFDGGALPWIEATLKHHQPRLLIIDPISYLYVLKRTGNQFEETKDMLFPLRWLGKQYHCAIVCLDHRRKRSREDLSVFDTLHGSVAKQAVADGLLMIDRDDTEVNMSALIRSGKDQLVHITMEFNQGRVYLNYKSGGESTPSSYSDLRARVFTLLQQSPVPLTINELMALADLPDTRQNRNSLYQILIRAVRTKEVDKTTRNGYIWVHQD